jgi:hypothetical protein
MKTSVSKKRIFTFLLLGLMFMSFLFVFVSAADTGLMEISGDSLIARIYNPLFGLQFPGPNWQEIVVVSVIFLVFFMAFSDILANFSGFSGWVSWFIGFGIAMILALSRACLYTTIWMLGFLSWLGAFSIFVAIAMSFIAFALLHFGSVGIGRWVIKRQMMLKTAKNANKATNVAAVGTAMLAGITRQLETDAGGKKV